MKKACETAVTPRPRTVQHQITNGGGSSAKGNGRPNTLPCDAAGSPRFPSLHPAILFPTMIRASACFVDYDRDGFLDLIVSRYLEWDFSENIYCGERKPGYRGQTCATSSPRC